MIALIPARGGSKGLPGKNSMLFHGKPLIAYAIEAALQSEYIDEVYVSTDDEQIAEVAKQYGAKVPFLRPEFLASDTALAVDTYNFMLDRWEEMGKEITSFIVLQPTSPLRTARHINEAVALFNSKNAESVISYTQEAHPISWHKYVNDDFSFSDIFENSLGNRQEKKLTYYPNGAIFIFKSDLIRQKKYYSEQSFAYLMSKEDSVDIDYIEDFEYAEFLFNKRLKNEQL